MTGIKIMLMTANQIDSLELESSLPIVRYKDILKKPFRLKEICAVADCIVARQQTMQWKSGLTTPFNINTVCAAGLCVSKSDDCVNNEHGSCKGIIKEAADLTKMCACPCHDSMYQLVRNTIAVLNRDQRNNPYQFTHDADT